MLAATPGYKMLQCSFLVFDSPSLLREAFNNEIKSGTCVVETCVWLELLEGDIKFCGIFICWLLEKCHSNYSTWKLHCFANIAGDVPWNWEYCSRRLNVVDLFRNDYVSCLKLHNAFALGVRWTLFWLESTCFFSFIRFSNIASHPSDTGFSGIGIASVSFSRMLCLLGQLGGSVTHVATLCLCESFLFFLCYERVILHPIRLSEA